MSGEEMIIALESLSEKNKAIVTALIESLSEADAEKNEKWLDTDEAAETLGLTRATIRTYAMEGKLEGRRVSPRKILVSSSSVNAMKQAQTRF